MKTKAFVEPSSLVKHLLPPEERAKIRFVVNPFDDNGLFDQFPEISEQSEAWTKEAETLFAKAKDVIATLIDAPEYKEYFRNSVHLNMGWKINEVLAQLANPPRGWHIWSINLNDNKNLGLVFTESGELIIVTHQYQHQDDYTQGFHWLLRHDSGGLGRYMELKVDSHRLHQVLTVLADPEKARAYFRARIHCLETFTD